MRTSDIAIEQDVAWFVDPATGRGRIVVSHDAKPDGTEPTLEAHFFDRVRPLVEAALRDNRKDTWPVMVLHLDFKTNEPAHHQAVWDLLGKYESWLTTAERVADEQRVTPFTPGPLLVLTEAGQNQVDTFYTRVPVGGRLRLFGTIPPVTLPGGQHRRRARGRRSLGARRTCSSPPARPTTGAGPTSPGRSSSSAGRTRPVAWTSDDNRRLRAIVARAHEMGLWVRFYTLNGHPAAESKGWTASYNFGSLAAVRERMAAARDAGVEFIATDQYEELGAVLSQGAPGPQSVAPGPSRATCHRATGTRARLRLHGRARAACTCQVSAYRVATYRRARGTARRTWRVASFARCTVAPWTSTVARLRSLHADEFT